MTNTKKLKVGEFYNFCNFDAEVLAFGQVLAISEFGVKVRGYGETPTRWLSFKSIAAAYAPDLSQLMNVYGK